MVLRSVPSTFIRYCFGNPLISCEINCLPVLPKDNITYIFIIIYIIVYISNYREIYHARRWHSDYGPPMVIAEIGYIFTMDFVNFCHELTMGKVVKFYHKVSNFRKYTFNIIFIQRKGR